MSTTIAVYAHHTKVDKVFLPSYLRVTGVSLIASEVLDLELVLHM